MNLQKMNPVLSMVLGALCITSAPIAVKYIQLDSTVVAFYRCFLASIFLFLYYLLFNRQGLKAGTKLILKSKKLIYLILGASLFFFLDLLVWHKSIHYIGAGFATVLGNTQVFYLALLSVFLYKLKIKKIFWISLLMAFTGICLMFYEKPNWASGTHYHWGIIFGLMTGLFYASYIQSLKKIQEVEQNLSVALILAYVIFLSSVFLALYSYIFENLVIPVRGYDIFWLLLLAIVAQIMGWVFITNSIGKLVVHLAALLLLIQPSMATLLGSFLFGESLRFWQIVGCVLTLTGIYAGQQSIRTKSK